MTNMCNCPYDTPTDRDFEENDSLHCGYCRGYIKALHQAPATTTHRKTKRKVVK